MIRKLQWDSDFFNFSIGEIIDFSDLRDQHEFDLIYVKGSSDKSIIIEDFSNEFSETKVVFSKKTASFPLVSDHIRSVNVDDSIKELYDLAYESGKFSRFKLDEKIGRYNFEKLYRTWVDNSINKQFADDLIVFKNNKKIAGFATYKIDNKTATIGLIAVSSDYQGKGIGTKLLQHIENLLIKEKVEMLHIPTQLENKPACSFYSNQGYVITDKTYLKHYWKNDPI